MEEFTPDDIPELQAIEVTQHITDFLAKLRHKKARLQWTGPTPSGHKWIVHNEVQFMEMSNLLSS